MCSTNVTIEALGALQGIASPTCSPHSQTANDMTSWQLTIMDTTRVAHVKQSTLSFLTLDHQSCFLCVIELKLNFLLTESHTCHSVCNIVLYFLEDSRFFMRAFFAAAYQSCLNVCLLLKYCTVLLFHYIHCYHK
jgi:hypothetical protein